MDTGQLLASLDDQQRRAATSPASPLAVIAPAGSGKTRVLTARVLHRIAEGDAEATHTLCVTFTRKAAGELGSRLRDAGLRERIEAGTFHSIALRQLRDRWAAAGRVAPTLLDRPATFVKEQLGLDDATSRELTQEVAWARARLVSPADYPDRARAEGRRTRSDRAVLATRYADYEAAKARTHVVDFDDVLAACTAAIEGDPEFGRAQRWRFRHLYVDEFQDVNPLQFALLEAWRGDRWDVFVVGDPHQSIYAWNGADPGLLTDLDRRWPALETIHLDRTHRSTPEITAAAASVIAAAGLPDRHPESSGDSGPRPVIHEHRDELDEIAVLAARLRRASRDEPWSAMAVLARTQQQVAELERGLRVYGIPVAVRRNVGILDDPDVRSTLASLSRDDRPLPVALAAAIPPDDIADADDSDESVATGESVATDESDDRPTDAIVRAADRFSAFEPAPTGRSFAGWARSALVEAASKAPDAVTLTTMHAAKGLEWPIVHVAMCEDGSIPHVSARRRAARDEEARLLYVALTRAERELELHWARGRTIANRRRDRQPSPFLARFEAFLDALPQPEPSAGTSHLADLRGRISRPAPPDPLWSALQAWRANRARAARTVPAAVLADASLAAIAERRPTTLDALVDIPALGPARAARLGPDIIELVQRSAAPLRSRA